jgi:hypothetical protein
MSLAEEWALLLQSESEWDLASARGMKMASP